jgi:class 3 adenylate cyclase/ketosteroid isomerase-like protein
MEFRKSHELIAIMQRLMVAIQSGDTATVRSIFTNDAETLLIGNRGEWLYGREAQAVITAQLSIMPEYDKTFHSVEAYADGNFGWGAAKHTVTLPGGPSVDGRTTAVFRIEDGVWRVVQWHASSPRIDHEGWFEMEVPLTLSELVGSLGDDLDSLVAGQLDTSHVTFIISDIEDSTRLGVEFGDDLWTDAIERHFRRLHQIADVHGGEVVKTLGDGALMAFVAPTDAARAALAIQAAVDERPDIGAYRVRVGVHMGPAVRSDDDYLGYTVNKTARLASAASGGEVLVSKQVAEAVGGSTDLDIGEPRALSLKGLPGTHVAHPLTPGS